MCCNPGSEYILSWLLQGGAKKCHVSGPKNPIAVPQSPKPVLQDQRIVVSNLCQNTQKAVKQTETQEWRKQTQNQAGCCSVVKQCP